MMLSWLFRSCKNMTSRKVRCRADREDAGEAVDSWIADEACNYRRCIPGILAVAEEEAGRTTKGDNMGDQQGQGVHRHWMLPFSEEPYATYLCICGVLKSIKDFLQRHHLVGFAVDSLPDHTIGLRQGPVSRAMINSIMAMGRQGQGFDVGRHAPPCPASAESHIFSLCACRCPPRPSRPASSSDAYCINGQCVGVFLCCRRTSTTLCKCRVLDQTQMHVRHVLPHVHLVVSRSMPYCHRFQRITRVKINVPPSQSLPPFL